MAWYPQNKILIPSEGCNEASPDPAVFWVPFPGTCQGLYPLPTSLPSLVFWSSLVFWQEDPSSRSVSEGSHARLRQDSSVFQKKGSRFLASRLFPSLALFIPALNLSVTISKMGK